MPGDGSVFVDWLSAVEHYPSGGLPILIAGLRAYYDRWGNCRLERVVPATVAGSHDTVVRVGCDGSRVFISGNVGRLGREDNLFNLGWPGTVAAANRVLAQNGLPALGTSRRLSGATPGRGARVVRVDLTANFCARSEAQARAVIRWLGAQAVQRVKRGNAGDSSIWYGNTRHYFKAYLKGEELMKHGLNAEHQAVRFCESNGVVRVEVELKRRLLHELGLDDLDAISQAKLEDLYREHTGLLRRVDRSDDPDIIAAVPSRVRPTLAAWLRGQDMKAVLSNGTLYRHAKVLKEYGIDILEPRNVVTMNTKVRVVELEPLAPPAWHWVKAA